METYAVASVTKLRLDAPQSADLLTDILRRFAQTLLQQDFEGDVQSYLSLVNLRESPAGCGSQRV